MRQESDQVARALVPEHLGDGLARLAGDVLRAAVRLEFVAPRPVELRQRVFCADVVGRVGVRTRGDEHRRVTAAMRRQQRADRVVLVLLVQAVDHQDESLGRERGGSPQ